MPLHHHTQHMNRHIGAIRPPFKLLFFIGTCLTARTHVLASIRMVPYGITTTMTTRKIRHSPAASRPLLLPELRMLRASTTHEQAGGVVFSTEGAGMVTSSGCSGDSRKSNNRENYEPLLTWPWCWDGSRDGIGGRWWAGSTAAWHPSEAAVEACQETTDQTGMTG